MSILIKGMKMPISCESCPCKTADAFGGLGCQATGYIPLRRANQDRPDNCPLVPVPPHGDLISRETAKLYHSYLVDERTDIRVPAIPLSVLNVIPAIIPAEEE